METTEKTFRYTYTFKNLGVFYLMFLFSCIAAGLFMGQREFMFSFLPIMLGFGVVLLIPYLSFRISISDLEITKKTLLGTRSLQWSDINRISSKGSLLKLHNFNSDTTLSINPRLDGSAEIFDLLFSKRPDLFEAHKDNPFLRSDTNNIGKIVFGIFLVVLAAIGYFRETSLGNYIGALWIGLFFCLQAVFSLISNPRKITLGNNSLVVHYLNKLITFSADDIASIQIGKTKQEQFKSVFIVFPNNKLMEISGYKQTPFIIYPVLKQWHEKYAKEQPNPSA